MLRLRFTARSTRPWIAYCGMLAFAGILIATPSRADDPAAGKPATEKLTAPTSRTFLFHYRGAITGQQPGTQVRVWLPVPSSSVDQQVRLSRIELPAAGTFNHEPKYGNQILFFEAPADERGRVAFAVSYDVERFEVRGDSRDAAVAAAEVELFLRPDAKVPVAGKPLTLLRGKQLPMDQFEIGRTLYQLVNDHMTYSKQGTGWGNGDSNWACDSRYGNCSDFHSLFISLARSQSIPAKFEMGFPLPESRGSGDIPGYHCWGKFRPEGRGWIPVDISEANKAKMQRPELVSYYFGNLTENRIAFTVGRDLTLVPKQAGPPLNYLIYPYAEVDGIPVAGEKIEKKFGYEDR